MLTIRLCLILHHLLGTPEDPGACCAVLGVCCWGLLLTLTGVFEHVCMQVTGAPARANGVSQWAGAGQVNCKRNHYLKTPQLVVSPLGGHPAAMQVWMLKV